jgi:WD40 repeat protein
LSERGRAYVQRARVVERRRLLWKRLGFSALIVGLTATVAVLATLNRRANEATSRAEPGAVEIQVRRLAAGAELAAREGKPHLELLLAVEAERLARSKGLAVEEADSVLINAVNGEPPNKPLRESSALTSMRWSSDGRRILGTQGEASARDSAASVGPDLAALMWDVAPAGGPTYLEAPESVHPDIRFESIHVTPDGTRALAVTHPRERELRIRGGNARGFMVAVRAGTLVSWDLASPEVLTTLGQFRMNVAECTFSSDGNRLLALVEEESGIRGTSACLMMTDASAPPSCLAHGVAAAAISPDGMRVAVAYVSGTVEIQDANGGGMPTRILDSIERPRSVAFSADGQRLLVAGNDKRARLVALDRVDDVLLLEERAHITSTAFRPDRERIAVCLADGTISIWHLGYLESGKMLMKGAVLHAHEDGVGLVALPRRSLIRARSSESASSVRMRRFSRPCSMTEASSSGACPQVPKLRDSTEIGGRSRILSSARRGRTSLRSPGTAAYFSRWTAP